MKMNIIVIAVFNKAVDEFLQAPNRSMQEVEL